jgi:hypothetical protein
MEALDARGLEPVGPPVHLIVFLTFAAGLLLAFVAVAIVLWGACAALRASGRDQAWVTALSRRRRWSGAWFPPERRPE